MARNRNHRAKRRDRQRKELAAIAVAVELAARCEQINLDLLDGRTRRHYVRITDRALQPQQSPTIDAIQNPRLYQLPTMIETKTCQDTIMRSQAGQHGQPRVDEPGRHGRPEDRLIVW